ncbi:MAG: DNA polymerase III beta chain [Ignavibacteria bacterium]|nr:MAG: DNA polymerase III beta chain [Ignavibacteria bacterium]KAF0159089.1 MAG: DNA polymerase III beta chain [Ignavibacteria bacterium]
MEFKVNSKELEKLLSKIIPAVPTRTPMPILENFLFDVKDGQLTIYATDLEISLIASLNIVTDENVKMVVPARLLYDFIRSLKDTTIHFLLMPNKKINLVTDAGKYTISYLEADEYPVIPTLSDDKEINEVSINGIELRTTIERVSFAMSKEEMRPAMMGTLFEFTDEGLRFVTTDGHRLVNLLKRNIKSLTNNQYVVPERAVSVLTKILDEKDVKIYMTKTYMSFKLNDIELITRLIAQKYPDYSSVIPLENEFLMKVKTKELHDSIKRMMLFSTSSNTRRVKFSIEKTSLEISAEDLDIGASGEEKVACEYTGEKLEIGFNSAFVNDVLNHLLSEEEITFKLHSATKAVVIEPVQKKESQEMIMLLMPVRLNS